MTLKWDKQFEVSIWHNYDRILDCNLSEYDTLTSWDGIIMSKFCPFISHNKIWMSRYSIFYQIIKLSNQDIADLAAF